MMTFNEYQEHAEKTAVYPSKIGMAYTALGLAGEAGEVANKVKKVYRDASGRLGPVERVAISDELGDCLWYLASLANEIGVPLDVIARNNIEKLRLRQASGKLCGSGDKR